MEKQICFCLLNKFSTTKATPSDAEAEIFWDKHVNAMATDDLAPCVMSSAAAMILTI